jgi:hypothetical protein
MTATQDTGIKCKLLSNSLNLRLNSREDTIKTFTGCHINAGVPYKYPNEASILDRLGSEQLQHQTMLW